METDRNKNVPSREPQPPARLGGYAKERERIVREYASGSPLETFADRATRDDDENKAEIPGDKNADSR